ncbi:MAG TPA: Hsp20/alpha crystallin family protein, partial [Flavisolibacter sp.]
MTVVRFKNRPNSSVAFNNLLSDVFPQFPSIYKEDLRQATPVNIRETEKEYLLDVVAPGLSKDDFKISLENNLLTVSVEKKEETVSEGEKFIRREFQFQGFKRSFSLDEKINADGISAQYVNGVLTLNLPKR